MDSSSCPPALPPTGAGASTSRIHTTTESRSSPAPEPRSSCCAHTITFDNLGPDFSTGAIPNGFSRRRWGDVSESGLYLTRSEQHRTTGTRRHLTAAPAGPAVVALPRFHTDRKSTRLNSSHTVISY